MNPGLHKYLRTFHYIFRNILDGSGIFPFYASFKVTSKCASSCPHCYVSRENPTPDLDTESAKKVIENIVSSSTIVLTFEGGEPFLRGDFGELLEYADGFPVFVSVVTSYPDISIEGYSHLSRFVDFLQISIDENHGNVHLLEQLHRIMSEWNTRICIQTIVTNETMDLMKEKVHRANEHECKILFIPVSPLYPDLLDMCPDRNEFVERVQELKRRYPDTVICSSYFLEAYRNGKGCSSSSIIIDSDGSVFYPCHVLKKKPFNLLDGKLKDFLLSEEANEIRASMKNCSISCGWYQYFALSLKSVKDLPRDISSALERIR